MDKQRRARGVISMALLMTFALAGPVGATEVNSSETAKSVAAEAEHRITTTTAEIEYGIVGSREPISVVTKTIDGAAPLTIEIDAVPPGGDRGTESTTCWWAKPKYYTSTSFGTVTYSYYYIEWCSDGSVVTSVPSLWCGGAAYKGWSYQGCSVSRGSTGYSSVYINGNWDYRLGYIIYVNRHVEVDARHYASGSYSGTWVASQ